MDSSTNLIGVHAQSAQYILRHTNVKLSETNLKITRCALSILTGLSIIGIIASAITTDYRWMIGCCGTTLSAGLALFTTYCCMDKVDHEEIAPFNGRKSNNSQENLFPKGATLQPTPAPGSQNHVLLNELCERDINGDFKGCSLDRLQEIIDTLKSNTDLALLNAISNYHLENPIPTTIYHMPTYITPLHYWVMKGNLDAVQILMENGGQDYFTAGKKVADITTGTYLAALSGHAEILQFLLGHEGRVDISFFNKNILYCFIPRLVFELMPTLILQEQPAFDKLMECLRIVLVQLKEKHPDNLKLQCKIPVREGKNIIAWIDQEYGESPKAQHVKELLCQFGADTNNVYSRNELLKLPFNTGSGCMLADAASYK